MCNHCLLGQKFHISGSIRADRCHKDTLPRGKPTFSFTELSSLTCTRTGRSENNTFSRPIRGQSKTMILSLLFYLPKKGMMQLYIV